MEQWKQPRKEKNIGTKIISTFHHLILTLNNFVFNCQNYLQIKGYAMGTKCAPNYANIFMDIFEGRHKYPLIDTMSKFYLRFIDDIFLIWTGEAFRYLIFNHLLLEHLFCLFLLTFYFIFFFSRWHFPLLRLWDYLKDWIEIQKTLTFAFWQSLRKMPKLSHQEIRWNYGILCVEYVEASLTQFNERVSNEYFLIAAKYDTQRYYRILGKNTFMVGRGDGVLIWPLSSPRGIDLMNLVSSKYEA